MTRGALVAAVLISAACRREASTASHAPDGAITVASSEVEFGRAFPATVTRVVREGAKAAGEPSLAPLVTRLVGTTTASRGEPPEVVEERHYLAWAFATGEVDLPSLKLHVRTSLPPDDAGRPELPEEPLPVPRPSRAWPIAALALAVAVVVTLAALAFVRARRKSLRGRPAAATAPRVAADARARARIVELRRRPLADHAALLALHDEAASLLRDYVEARFEPSAASRTSEELIEGVARAPAIGAGPRTRLSALLPPLDRVRFGRGRAPREAALRLLDELDAFVSETSP